ncbi:MAG: TSUP family transporter, partial [Pseudobdellovibrio sp.]
LTSYALISLTNKNFKIKPTDQNAIIGGGLSGLLTGLIGTGGAIRGAALSAFGLSKGAFISTSAAIDLSSDLARAAIYLKQGYLEARYYSYLPGLLLAAYAGVFSGKKILTFFTPRMFRTLVLLLILGTGLFLIYKETSELIQS